MSSSRPDLDLAEEPLAAETRDPRRALRRTWSWGACALVCLYAPILASRRPGQALVVLGVDSYGWTYLFGMAAAVLTGLFIGGLVYVHTRNRRSWWPKTVSALTLLLLSFAALIGLPVALLAGFLSFKISYREIGAVDGRVIVVQQFAGWDTDDDELDAGYRNGPFVTFQAGGDSFLDRPPTAIRAWRFTVAKTPSTVEIHYRAGPQARGRVRVGVLGGKPQ